MLYNIACEWYSVVEAKCLVGRVSRFGSFANHVNLFLGIAASFGEQDVGSFDNGRFDTEETVMMIYVANILLELVKNGLLGW